MHEHQTKHEDNPLINNRVVHVIMHGILKSQRINKSLESVGHKVKLEDIIEASPPTVAVGDQIYLNQTLTYEGKNLKLLLFMALVLLKSKTLFSFLDNNRASRFTEMLALIMKYKTFIYKHADELNIPSRVIKEDKAAFFNSLLFRQKAAIASFLFFNTKKCKKLGMELKASLNDTNRLAPRLVDNSSLPQGINEPGIVSPETIRLGFSGWS